MTTQQPAPISEPAAPAAPAAAAPASPPAPAAAPAPSAPAAAAAPPAEYKFNLPEGVAFSPEMQSGITDFAKKAGLSQEHAQGLVDFAAAQLQAIDAKASEVRNGWKAAAEKDPEIGGEKLAPALAAAAEVIAAFAGQDATEFKQYLDTTGLGNHPVLIKVLARVRAQISSDKFVQGGSPPAPQTAQSFYPNSNMNP